MIERRLPIFAAAWFSALLFCACAFCDSAPLAQIESAKVLVDSLDSRGHIQHSSLGFQLDETTVVTSYESVKGAATLQLRSGDYRGISTRVVSCSSFMDLALVKTTEEMPMEPALGG